MVNGKWLMFNVGEKFPLTIIHLTLIMAVFLTSCQTDIQTINEIISLKDSPSESMKDAEIIYSDSARVKMKLNAVQLDRFPGEKEYIEMPKGMNILFYDDSMKVSSRLKADYGIRYEKDKRMEAKRNVEVVNVKGEKLNTEHLIWDDTKDSIYTKAFVKITTKDEVMWGAGLRSNQDFTKYKITNVTGVKYLQE